jgi:uncharacterized protein (DUF2236 family)
MISAVRLPNVLQRQLNASIDSLLRSRSSRRIDFSTPRGAQALTSPNSVSWRVFKNPIALFVGGTAAVILELADPAVRAGVWQHSSFRDNPFARLQRTGLAAMITIYGARTVAEAMIERVVRMHSSVQGTMPNGVLYRANDPRLLTWVHATAAYSFAAAYDRYVARLHEAEYGRLFCEGAPVARLYGADAPPQSLAEMQALFERASPRLEASPIVFDFLTIMCTTPALPRSLRWMQTILVRAAIELVPDWIRERLGLTRAHGLRRHERWLTQLAGSAADKIVLPTSPAVESCVRLGLPMSHLYE